MHDCFSRSSSIISPETAGPWQYEVQGWMYGQEAATHHFGRPSNGTRSFFFARISHLDSIPESTRFSRVGDKVHRTSIFMQAARCFLGHGAIYLNPSEAPIRQP